MAVGTGRHVQCGACDRYFHVHLPEPGDEVPLPATCVCGAADWKEFDAESDPCATTHDPIRIPVAQQEGPDGWLPPLHRLMLDRPVRDNVEDRLNADLLRRLGASEEEVADSMGYSPRPSIQGDYA